MQFVNLVRNISNLANVVAMGSMFSYSLLVMLVTMLGRFTDGHPGLPKVAVYMSESKGVLDLSWDNGPMHLLQQLTNLRLMVETAADAQPCLFGDGAPSAYVIPAQNGHTFYVSAENMTEITTFLSRGGLVIILDAAGGGEGAALRDFVAKALNLKGTWTICKQTSTTDKPRRLGRSGAPVLSDAALSFLPGASIAGVANWPKTLEDARTTSVYTTCRHEDGDAITWPLYTNFGDNGKVAAQAFGKVGVPGAVVWLGYSWKDGPQEQWGALINKIITDFANGTYKPLRIGGPVHSDEFLDVFEATTRMAEDAHNVMRRSLVAPGNYLLNPSHSNGDNGNNDNYHNGKNVRNSNAVATKSSRKLSEKSMGPLVRPSTSVPAAPNPTGVVKGRSTGNDNGNDGFPGINGNNGINDIYGGVNKDAENLTKTINKEIEELLIRFTQAMAQPPVYLPNGVVNLGSMQDGPQLPSSPQHDPLTSTAAVTATATTGMVSTAIAKATATSTMAGVETTAAAGAAIVAPAESTTATATAKMTTAARVTEVATTATPAIAKSTTAATKTQMGTIAAVALGVKTTSTSSVEGKKS
ncbi:hypothetical protein Vretimale_17278 [Volvox reticuliferus]|uniref:Uncharacterized protein n=1 Tax=Volvox reticuliferus TaxID=1737510 RepID=A0A8J4GUQ2_9CHLO|nr:hypothetical protein Vretifemale_16606 [Volvox reticuliferus]GIM14255.1 hypothetical protein Vretimale_17278 [Volvox reticuliferus]